MSKIINSPFVGVVTFNPMSTLRFELLERTVRSIEKAFPASELFLLDNGSIDGSGQAVREVLGILNPQRIPCSSCTNTGAPHGQYGRWHTRWRQDNHYPPGNLTPGAGCCQLNYLMCAHGNQSDSPFWVWSDDDMEWKEGAEAKLRRFWAEAPKSIAILSGLLEPVYSWNTPRETVEYGGVKALVRDSAPGAGWSFRDVEMPVICNEEMFVMGHDYKCCVELRKRGYKVAQIDLAEHIGWGLSTHGNDAINAKDARPLDREKWGV